MLSPLISHSSSETQTSVEKLANVLVLVTGDLHADSLWCCSSVLAGPRTFVQKVSSLTNSRLSSSIRVNSHPSGVAGWNSCAPLHSGSGTNGAVSACARRLPFGFQGFFIPLSLILRAYKGVFAVPTSTFRTPTFCITPLPSILPLRCQTRLPLHLRSTSCLTRAEDM